jgi:branched-chain amino acid transport system permease protein
MEIFLQTLTNGIMASFILILVALGLCLVYGILDIVNFAHGEFYMLGGFATWYFLEQHSILQNIPAFGRYIVVIIIAMIIVAVIGIITEKFVFRPLRYSHAGMMIAALGIMSILQAGALVSFGAVDKNISSPLKGQIEIGPVSFSEERLLAIICCIVFMVLLYLLISRTKIGKAMKAVAQDPEAALIQGINTGIIFSLAMGIGVALAAAAGALIGPIFYVNPYMGAEPLLKAFAAVILGGLGSLPGAIIGGLMIGMVETFVTTYVGAHFAMTLVFLIMIGVLIIRPRGIFGHVE